MVLNLALALMIMFVIAVMMITVQKKLTDAHVESKDAFMINLDWNSETNYDIDLYIRNPEGDVIYFRHKETPWGTLERDDLGKKNDTMEINGESIVYNINREVLHLRQLIPGEYTINVHLFSGSMRDSSYLPQNMTIEFLRLQPTYEIKYKSELKIELPVRGEFTAFSFTYNPDMSILVDAVTQSHYVIDLLRAAGSPGP